VLPLGSSSTGFRPWRVLSSDFVIELDFLRRISAVLVYPVSSGRISAQSIFDAAARQIARVGLSMQERGVCFTDCSPIFNCLDCCREMSV
jgi:hypothetical protein